MYLSAERLALANQVVQETFEQCCIAWQAIPHWDTGDPGQARVPNGVVNAPGFLPLTPKRQDFQLTVVQANAPTPDSLLAEVMASTAKLAGDVDEDVIPQLYTAAGPTTTGTGPQALQDTLIDARAKVENYGYRAPSCLITNTAGLKKLSHLVSGYSILQPLLDSANIDSLHRAGKVDPVSNAKTRLVLLGRRQRIAHGSATEASAGEEPVDLAVSVLPSLEVVGEAPGGEIALSIRISYATRIKDPNGLVAEYDT
jgi:hypothetical protein